MKISGIYIIWKWLASFGLLFILSVKTVSSLCEPETSLGEAIYRSENELMWCVLSDEELRKCEAFAEATESDQEKDEYTFGSDYKKIKCKRYQTRDECMKAIDENCEYRPNVMALDAGEVFVGGRYHSLVPILREEYSFDGLGTSDYYHSVAVIKKGTLPYLNTMDDLRGLKACFAKVGSLAGWTIPIHKLITTGVMKIKDCNNHVKSAIDFFGISCAVDSLRTRYNPLGDNPHKFCELCGSDAPGVRCTNQDPYAEYVGALKCLQEKGDIAFLNEKTVFQHAKNKDDFELLCPSKTTDQASSSTSYGQNQKSLTRRPVDDYEACSWGVAPGNAIVVSSAMDMSERQAIQRYMKKAAMIYGNKTTPLRNNLPYDNPEPQFDDNEYSIPANRDYDGNRPFGIPDSNTPFRIPDSNTDINNVINDGEEDEETVELPFRIFESTPTYGTLSNLMFSDATVRLQIIPQDEMSYKSYLDKEYGPSSNTEVPSIAINGVRKCRVGGMRLCVTSEPEMAKCVRMRTALNAQLLEPKMSCTKAPSTIHCMRRIRNNEADVVVLEAGDIYRAGYQYDLKPVMAEIYNLGTPHYYVVAVTKQRDNSSELIYLKRKNTCHTGVGHAAGWIIPMAWLISNERVRDYGCDSVRAAAEYFSKACAPGVRSSDFEIRDQEDYWEYSHLCDLCHGTSGHYCERNHGEDYFGHTGAFRCLVEGGGNVAFVKHTTVWENCDGKRKEWWARNQLTADYELLCRDGTRAPARDYKKCYLGKVKANAVVVNSKIGEDTQNAFVKLFQYAQQFYGQKVPDEFSFSMFYSKPPYADLIFQDATQQLRELPKQQQHYRTYLDREFLKAYSVVECRSIGSVFPVSHVLLILTAVNAMKNLISLF